MVCVLPSSAVDRRFEPQSGKAKDYKIDICYFSDKHAALKRKSKDKVDVLVQGDGKINLHNNAVCHKPKASGSTVHSTNKWKVQGLEHSSSNFKKPNVP
jgi:hypothetical protein